MQQKSGGWEATALLALVIAIGYAAGLRELGRGYSPDWRHRAQTEAFFRGFDVALVGEALMRAAESVANFQQEYPAKLQFSYGSLKYEKPFLVRSIWHDGQFTYIKTDATELPALYEMKDGDPALVDFQVQGSTYVVPKVIERGYLSLGPKRLTFAQQER